MGEKKLLEKEEVATVIEVKTEPKKENKPTKEEAKTKELKENETPEIKRIRKRVETNYQSIILQMKLIDNARENIHSLRIENNELHETIGEIKRLDVSK